MKHLRLLLPIFAMIAVPTILAFGQDQQKTAGMKGLVDAFPIEQNSMAIHKLAQPYTPFDKLGRKFAVLGYENGTFEAWAYPLKLFRNFQFSFFLQNSTRPITATDIVRFVNIAPEATTITYVYQSFTVKATFITPVREPGSMILLSVNSVVPLKIVCGFLPVLQPMWPAALGGQYAYWDGNLKAYIISEASGSNFGIVGSPAATGISYTPAHMLSDYPNQFTINIKDPASVRNKYVPIYMAGGAGKWKSVEAVYDSLKANPQKYYLQCVKHYADLEQNTLHLTTPVKKINSAFKWAKIAYDNLVVNNPNLGKGMVAGLAMSGTSERPGFGWFFGGDAYINSFSIDSYGAFHTVRDALGFSEKWQRADGKMAHELSQSAKKYVHWFKDYGYAYEHGDTTPFFIDAVYAYYMQSGDLQFVKDSWNTITKAYNWCLTTDQNHDGLMDNSVAGLGALEFGSLIGIESDVYISAVWVRAAYAMKQLAKAVGDKEYQEKAAANYKKADKTYEEKFWNPQKGYYSYAFNAKGQQVNVLTPWMSVGLAWNIGTPKHSDEALEQLASSELTTDWGVRTMSDKSKYYDPLNYNYGTVWPFITSWVAAADYQHRYGIQGYEMLLACVRHAFDNEPGDVTEVFSGASNIWLGEAVSHQGFSTAGTVLPLVTGLYGLQGDEPSRTVTFAPQFPADWHNASASNYKVGDASFAFDYHKSGDRVEITIRGKKADGYKVNVSPVFAPGTKIENVTVDGSSVHYQTKTYPEGVEPIAMGTLRRGDMKVEIKYKPTVEVLPPVIHTQTGNSSTGLRLISAVLNGKAIHVSVEGIAGKTYHLPLVNSDLVRHVEGGTLAGNQVKFTIPSEGSGYQKYELVMDTK